MLPGPGWRRAQWLRRLLAGTLVVAALGLALAPPGTGEVVPVLVATTDLGAGATLAGTDLAVQRWPLELAPTGTLAAPGEAVGQVLVGAARKGEPITDVRLAGARAGPGAAAVPVRLADPGVAALLGPGSRVDLIGSAPTSGEPVVLAADVTVVTVLPDGPGPAGRTGGRMILVSMPHEQAASVAAASVAESLAITLR